MSRRFLLTFSLWLAVPLRAETAAPVRLTDQDVLTRADTFSVEEQRYLIYLYARLNQPKLAQALADKLLTTLPGDRQTLLVLASMYVEHKDAAEVLRLARRFLSLYPGDNQGLYFLGAGHYLAREFAEANRVLRDLKQEQYIGRKFPYETDLAASAFAAGDWYRAMLAYQRLLRHHELGDELRDEVRRALDSLYREHLPRVEATRSQLRLENAQVDRTVGLHGSHLSDRNWLELRYTRDDVTLEAAPGLQAARAARTDFAGNLTTTHDQRWRTDVFAGVGDAGVQGGARLRYLFARQREVALEATGRGRATDSLVLEALDGRQDQIAFTTLWLIEADLALNIRTYLREVNIDDEQLGRGRGIDANLDYTVWRQGPRVMVGYRGAWAAFSTSSSIPPRLASHLADPTGGEAAERALLGSLVARRINRYGTGLLVTDTLADAWLYRLTAGVDYDFVLSSTGWNAGLAVSFFPRKSIELTLEGGYTTSATASNAGSSATTLQLFFRAHY